ncbi:hypothetical protein [Bradyrhizobium sp. ARR65]|uniref:hypothetical protein n=1 Tax=Bradyrhizobium sp. ARR65 TaxID=1040989 RepID=UPI0004679947|nr:hypothetical protein [Bradyrhizobium sp. ARR65]
MVRQRAYRAAVGGKHRGNRVVTTNGGVSNFRRLFITAAVLFGTGLFGPAAHAQAGPFAALAGRWAGSGTVTLDDGSTERIRCRATYAVGGPRMDLTLTCASESYKFDLRGDVVAEPGGAISGTWSEASRNVTGNLQGRGRDGSFQVVASGPGFNANISLVTRGNRQSITMRAENQFRGASITLSR